MYSTGKIGSGITGDPPRKRDLEGGSISEGISGRRRIRTEFENTMRPGSVEEQVDEMLEEYCE